MASAANTNMNAVRETMDVLLEISRLLNTGLDMESLSICVRLCEQGINPEALSSVIKELRRASDSLKVSVTQLQGPGVAGSSPTPGDCM
ncbi:mitotic-spindle organizing protein 1 [Hoplias malabaricus]|uniref:mitotic-spindle organizing protein 1 n=1 Tax=Hoplias malabaricus TaxID=27720 RepID=UPI0034632490